MDKVKVAKYSYMDNVDFKYKKYMCYNCTFFTGSECSKKRVVVECAKNHLKNKA